MQVPLQSLPTLQQSNTPTQLCVICDLTEGALVPLTQTINKILKRTGPSAEHTCDWPPAGSNALPTTLWAGHPANFPVRNTPAQAMGCQLLQENAVEGRVKGFAEVQADIPTASPSSPRLVTQLSSPLFVTVVLLGSCPLVLLWLLVETEPTRLVSGNEILSMLWLSWARCHTVQGTGKAKEWHLLPV